MSWLLGLMVALGCSNAGSPCDEMCDGTVRCIQGNDACAADGFTGDGDFGADCVQLCETAATGLTVAEEAGALSCLDCLRERADFDGCSGEEALDATCRDACRSEGAIAFRNEYGPNLFDAYPAVDCLRR